MSIKDLLKMLVTSCYSLFHYFFIYFHCFSWFSGRCPIFLSLFHLLHLFQQLQADCVYKKSLKDACYFLLQSVSLVFYSFSLFQLFQWKMTNFLKPVSFVTLVSAFSLFQLFQWKMTNFFKPVSFV